jgi:hypothetical protein
MSAIKSSAIAAILTLIGLPATAQQVISEPGYCAFFYPNANCQNKGPGNPYTDPNYQRSYYGPGQSVGVASGQTVGVAPPKPRAYRSKAQ